MGNEWISSEQCRQTSAEDEQATEIGETSKGEDATVTVFSFRINIMEPIVRFWVLCC